MAINTDTHVERISLSATPDLAQAIKQICDIQASRDEHRRLAATFAAKNHVILIFQRTPD